MILGLALFFSALTLANALFWPRVRRSGARSSSAVSVLIPARDEQANIGPCLSAVLEQGSSLCEVLVYDDQSSDRTADVVHQIAAADSRVRLLSGLPLPSGWMGKNFACAQLAARARAVWMLFLDADARLQPGALDRLAAEAVARNLTFLSAWPGFLTVGFWESALMPMLNFAVFSIFPAPLSLLRPEASLGLAHGACILVHREAYEKLGGHENVRGKIFEDTELARLWRSRGERGLCLDGQDLVRVRMYTSLPEIWLGFQKNFFRAFHRETSFWTFLALHAVVFTLPFLSGSWSAAVATLAARAALAIRFRQRWWSPLVHPLAEAVFLALALSSWQASLSGRGVVWKGRQYS